MVVSLSGCLGTIVEAPTASTPSPAYAVLRVHLVAAPRVIRANECKHGVSEVATYVPLWGLAIGILTFGIVVPQWTLYSCVDAR
jgi:hypothetical protein